MWMALSLSAIVLVVAWSRHGGTGILSETPEIYGVEHPSPVAQQARRLVKISSNVFVGGKMNIRLVEMCKLTAKLALETKLAVLQIFLKNH